MWACQEVWIEAYLVKYMRSKTLVERHGLYLLPITAGLVHAAQKRSRVPQITSCIVHEKHTCGQQTLTSAANVSNSPHRRTAARMLANR